MSRRAAQIKAAGGVLHAYAKTAANFAVTGLAECGARRDAGALFTTLGRDVSCPDCRAIAARRREAARARLAEIEARGKAP